MTIDEERDGKQIREKPTRITTAAGVRGAEGREVNRKSRFSSLERVTACTGKKSLGHNDHEG